jgi:1-deoxy-D-xylulose-5-phosphate reductoisomerase
MVVNSLVGSIGIRPTIRAIKSGKDVALANKETLVTAGEIIMGLAREHDTLIYPVDSEHSAIFQCLHGEDHGGIERIIITCSGGAFRDRKKEELPCLLPGDALRHPSWSMGEKITIDSATLMNKGFEVIEARMLFGVDYNRIEVVIHPQSIIHSLVEFADRSVLAQLSSPDMRLPIQYALTYPDRIETGLKPLDLARIRTLTFSPPDTGRFPCLDYAYEAGRIGGTMPCVLNAANEVAVRAFLQGAIGFTDIPAIIRRKLDDHAPVTDPGIDEILELDERIKRETYRELRRKAG